MNTGLKANVMLLIVTMFWGSSYLFMKMGLTDVQEFNLIALRFGLAFILSGIVFHRRLIHADFKTVKYAFWQGTILFLVFAAITFGVKSTSASNAGFLVSLTVVFVPLLLTVRYRRMPENRVIVGVILALTGIGLLTLTSRFVISSGDLLCILGALMYAIHIVVTGKLTKSVDSLTLGILQLGFAGAWGLVFSALLEQPQLPDTADAWVSVLGLSLFCSAFGFIVQTAAQKYTTPTHTGLLFSLEPVFAAWFAFAFAGESLSLQGYAGAALVLLSVLTAQIDIKKILRKPGFHKSSAESKTNSIAG
ncbi:DMT family transporter [Paenibacillus sabinae]|uniref:EamA domain-containing protein n=1 Tax=Paenibacillus sabinae T27 TaxID=1268072 RepID=X4ZTQ0_9BACL|nr:DMT family transporter [Paenibacillus sabinae]AHV95743.1 hypothetical protein PSAB_04035 [Paenibacillus sabinae T27]